MPRIVPNVGDNVELLHMQGDGTHMTYGVVKERDGDEVLIEETHYAHFVYNKEKSDDSYFQAVPITAKHIGKRSLVNWIRPEDDVHHLYNCFEKTRDSQLCNPMGLTILSPDFFSKIEEVGPVPK